MKGIRILALILIVAGALGLVYGGFSYTKQTDVAKLGPIELTVKEKETVNVPLWAGIGLIAAIPAVVFYNKLNADSERILGGYESFADEFATILSRQLDA